MPSSQEQKKFYLKSPDLEYNLKGPIQIGNIITDMMNPQDPISTLKSTTPIITGTGYGQGKKEHECHASVSLDVSAKIYEFFGGQAEARSSNSLRTVYDFDEIVARYFQNNPTKGDVEKLRHTDQQVRGALNRGPVYIVTGLKIAKGLRYSNKRKANLEGSLRAQGHVTKEASFGGTLDGNRGEEDLENYTIIGDTILAYRLHIVKKEGFRWFGERDLGIKTLNPGQAGFMNHNKKSDEEGIEVEEVTIKDVKYFAEDEEYGDVEEASVEDGEEEWSLLCVYQ